MKTWETLDDPLEKSDRDLKSVGDDKRMKDRNDTNTLTPVTPVVSLSLRKLGAPT